MEHFLAYVRVSSHEQAERNLSIPSQIEQIKQYARNNGIVIKKLYEEEHSAFKWERPVFNSMLKELKKSKSLWGLVVFKYDRISRRMEDFLKLDNIIREWNLEIVSVTEPMLNSYLWRYMVRDMQNRAILYSEELSFRIKLWLRKKLQSGGDIGGSPPYWYIRTKNWYFIWDTNTDKAKIVKEVFDMYATWYYGMKQIASVIRHDFELSKFWTRNVESIINQSMYCWIRTKSWRLSKEEYLFRWYDKPWTYTEQYELNYLQPIISKELFEKCQNIKNTRNKQKKKPTWVRRFPALFVCSCWRNMRRDDKKNIRYLKCPSHINNKFPVRCWERYTNMSKIDDSLKEIVYSLIPSQEVHSDSIKKIEGEMKMKSVDKNRKITQSTHKHCELSDKLEEVTDKFVEWVIDNKQYRQLSTALQKKIENVEAELDALKDFRSYTEAGQKTIKFLQILQTYKENLDNSPFNKKSSQRIWVLYHIVANLTIVDRNISSYQLSEPFNILKNVKSWDWWRQSDA